MDNQTIVTVIFASAAFFLLLVFTLISFKSKAATRAIGLLGIAFGLIYIAYRAAFTFPDSFSLSLILAVILFAAEVLGFFQSLIFKTFYSTRKAMKPNKDIVYKRPPTLDVIISTYNEPLSVLSRTVLSALRLDWPPDRLKVYVGDDGRRKEVRDFCDKVGAIYVTRDNNAAAKAGNINNVLKTAKGELFLLLDADMIPKRTIAMEMLPYFQDSKTGFVQSPQVFYNYDVYQHNLNIKDRIPNEQDFFMRTMMDKRAAYNAVLHIGSNAIFRRSAVDDIGGIPTKSITEDMATGMLLQAKGYKSFYVNKALAVGRSVETIGDFIKQRDRWLRGSLQVARRYNPLTIKGLSLAQRILYFDGVLYWTFGIQKMIYILAPFMYLFFGLMLFNINNADIAFIFLPYFISNIIYFRRVSDEKRSMTWSHIYDIVLAPQMAWSFLKSVFTGKGLRFNVTPKNVQIGKSRFNWKLAWPQIILMAMSIVGIGLGTAKIVSDWDTAAVWSAALNLVWCAYNGLGIAVSLFVFRDRKDLRKSMRMRSFFAITDLAESENKQDVGRDTDDIDKKKDFGRVVEISDDGAVLAIPKTVDGGNLLTGREIYFTIDGIGHAGAIIRRRIQTKHAVRLGVEFNDIGFQAMTNISQYRFSQNNKYITPSKISKKRNSFIKILIGAVSRH